MTRLILDIETSGVGLDSLDPAMRQYMLRDAETKEQAQEVDDTLSFYPLTAQVVAIGLLNADTLKGEMYYLAPGEQAEVRLALSGMNNQIFGPPISYRLFEQEFSQSGPGGPPREAQIKQQILDSLRLFAAEVMPAFASC